MDLQIALMLVQDGIVNGAIYALMALALVLVFSVTRVIFIPQGEFVAYAALAMAALQTGKLPPLLWMLLGMAALCLVVEAVRQARGLEVDWKSTLFWAVALPALAALMLLVVKPQAMWLQVVAVLLLVTPMGPLVYRLAFRPLAHATVLILLIVSVALHLAMVGLGLFFFGAEGSRTGHIGMGLGFFIAKTLLERTGAVVTFQNARPNGAVVAARWPRAKIEASIA